MKYIKKHDFLRIIYIIFLNVRVFDYDKCN